MGRRAANVLAFAARCAVAAMLSYAIAHAIGLPQEVWAVLSSIIVSQDRLDDTRASLFARVASTILGAVIAVIIGEIGLRLHAPVPLQMGVAVAIAAAPAHFNPKLRVAMWTSAIVLLTASAAESLPAVALRRASEVALGAVVGWAVHWAAANIAERARRR